MVMTRGSFAGGFTSWLSQSRAAEGEPLAHSIARALDRKSKYLLPELVQELVKQLACAIAPL